MSLAVPMQKVVDLSKTTTIREVRCSCNKLLLRVEDIHGSGMIATVCPRCRTPINIIMRGPLKDRV